jgi:DNA-3-methyladenine glycosylase II
MPSPGFRVAAAEVAQLDPALGRVIELAGPVRLPRDRVQPFPALVRSIVYQQLAGAAAGAIHGRFVALFGPNGPTPRDVLAVPEARLRGVGLSSAKVASIRDLATKATDGTVALDRLRRLPDDEVVAQLMQVRGIGRWTAEMYLIFRLARPDVWPVDDLGVRRGWQLAHDLPAMPSSRALSPLGEPFRPHRTTVAWYCWRAVHLWRGLP